MEKVLAFFISGFFISGFSGGGVTISLPEPFKIPKISRFF